MIVILIVPLSSLIAQDIWYNKQTGFVESTTDKAIDLSKIVSDWKVLRKDVKDKDSIILQKNKTIKKLESLIADKIARIDELTDVVIKQNSKVDSIGDRQIKTALKAYSRFSLRGEIFSEINNLENIKALARLNYDLERIYLFTSAIYENNNNSNINFGIGYKF